MSFGPVPVSNIQLNIPPNKQVFFSLATQASNKQIATITNATGTQIAQLSLQQNPGNKIMMFNSGSNTALYLTISAGTQPVVSQGIYDDSILNIGQNVYTGYYIFATEDGTDRDYNDALVTIAWTTIPH